MNVAEVEQLVKRLYQPAPPAVLVQINDELQKIQLSQDGWKLADELMRSDDTNVRFFGALTFTVKLNNDGPSLDDETAQTVLMRLLYWLVRLVRQGEGGLVCKKLCSTLTTYFTHAPLLWESPLLHLAICLHQGDAVSTDEVKSGTLAMPTLLPSLNEFQITVLLWFAGTLAEEVGRVDPNVHTHARLHNQMETVVIDASTLMQWSFQATSQPASPRAEALQTFLSWINYAQPVWPGKPDTLQNLRKLIEPAASCLLDRAIFQDALDSFRDILESYTSFFQPEHMQLLAKITYDHVRPNLLEALFGRDLDGQHVLYGQFVIAFGCANIQQVVEEPDNEIGSQAIVKLHLDIISAEGYPGDDDQLSVQSIEFWNTYIEYVNDVLFSEDSDEPEPTWLPQSKSILQHTFQLFWKKMLTPPPAVAQIWEDEEREGFKDFRIDAADLFLSIFVLLQQEMLQKLVELTLQSLREKQWHAVEASMFCLNTLADNVLEDTINEPIMESVFRSNLFREIADFSQSLPPQARRTAIDFLGSYSTYIERHAEFLPDALRFLFASLETTGLANAAAKSISSLCSTCRASLIDELPGFLSQYQRFLESNTSDAYTKEKVIGAIAAIIQALPREKLKAQPLLALLGFIEKDIAMAKQHAAAGNEEQVEAIGITALECLASIGKAMQVPDDVPIDVYAEDDKPSQEPSYWESEEGRAIQQRIVACFSALEVVGTYSAAIDAVCQVLRSGYAETEPGPFVLPPSVTVSFVQQCTVSTPQLENVLSTAGMLITQHSRQNSRRIEAEVSLIHDSIVGMIQTLGLSKEDPAVAMACIDVLTRLLPHYANILFGNSAQTTQDFILSAIIGPDSLPKRSASGFWTKFLQPQTAAIAPATQQQMNQVMASYGPKFASCLMAAVGGSAARSQLDFLCEALKALLMHHPHAWLQQGIMSEMFPKSRITDDEKARYLRQLVGARSDGKKIKDLTKEFWASCRGTVVSYTVYQ